MNGFFGFLFNTPLKVMTSDQIRFRGVNGLSGLNNVTGNVEVAGLVLKDASGNPVFVARTVQAEEWRTRTDPPSNRETQRLRYLWLSFRRKERCSFGI